MTSLASSPGEGGIVYSAGFDDCVREISSDGFTSVTLLFDSRWTDDPLTRPASISLSAQPRSLAVGGDGSVFVVELNGVEVIRSNQKVFDLPTTKYTPSTVAAKGSLVAIGAEVSQRRKAKSWLSSHIKPPV